MRLRVRTARPPLPILASIAAIALAVGSGAFFFPADAGDGPLLLAKVEVGGQQDWENLLGLGARLRFRGAGYLVVSMPSEALSSLDETGLAWSELPFNPDDHLYYVMFEGDSAPAPPGNMRLLLSDSDGFLVSAKEDAARKARLSGLKVMPLGEGRQLSKFDFVDIEFVHDEVAPLPDYQWITGHVSPDSLGSVIEHLQGYGTRYAYTPEINKAGQWLLRRLWGFGYTDTLLQNVHLEGKVSVAPGNVVATKPGSTVPEYRIIIGGHYDSISSGLPGSDAPGADDNASGTAGTLEIARLLAEVNLDATVEFVLFTAEELGLLGSLEYVTQLAAKDISTEKTFFINMDMIGNSGTRYRTKVFYNPQSEPMARLIASVGEAYSVTAPFLAGGMDRSDHASFWQFGYPAVFIHEMDFSPVYHSTEDLLEFLEMDYEAEVIKMVLGSVLHLANLADPPGDVIARQSESGDVLVEWTHSPDADLLGYSVEVIDGGGDVVYEKYTKDDFVNLELSELRGSYKVRVRPEDVLGFGDASAEVLVGSGLRLIAGAAPNPLTEGCQFEIYVPGSGGPVSAVVRIVDALGRQIAQVHDGPLNRGTNFLRWRGTLPDGGRVPGGVYFYVVETAGGGKTGGKLMVVR